MLCETSLSVQVRVVRSRSSANLKFMCGLRGPREGGPAVILYDCGKQKEKEKAEVFG